MVGYVGYDNVKHKLINWPFDKLAALIDSKFKHKNHDNN